jgi:hypothetical protein
VPARTFIGRPRRPTGVLAGTSSAARPPVEALQQPAAIPAGSAIEPGRVQELSELSAGVQVGAAEEDAPTRF